MAHDTVGLYDRAGVPDELGCVQDFYLNKLAKRFFGKEDKGEKEEKMKRNCISSSASFLFFIKADIWLRGQRRKPGKKRSVIVFLLQLLFSAELVEVCLLAKLLHTYLFFLFTTNQPHK